MTNKLEKISIIPAEEAPSMALTPMDMISRAVQSGADIEMIEKLMILHERWEKNRARKAFDEAISEAKAKIPVLNKNREVDFTSTKGRTHYKYEDLAEVARIVTPILAEHGLSYRFRATSNINEPISVTCIISHRGGHYEEITLTAGRDDSGNKNSIQQIGSTLTYLQRMTLKAALGLAAAEDDDGKASAAGESVTQDQLTKLVNLADEVGADKPAFCKYFRVESFAAIAAKDFDRAVAALNKKRAAK